MSAPLFNWALKEIVSFGAGTQSSAIALLAHNRDPRLLEVTDGKLPDHYIFADTGDEPRNVYDQLELFSGMLDVPLHVVTRHDDRRSLSDELCGRLESGKQSHLTWIPAFVGSDSRKGYGILQRRCTHEMKIYALRRAARTLSGYRHRVIKHLVCRQWLGISTDEITRLRESTEPWTEFFYPLIEMGWSRVDCEEYLLEHGIPVTKSACVYCPFRTSKSWQEMKDEEPEEFDRAVAFERRLHAAYDGLESPKLKSRPYLHRSLVPIDQVDFKTPGIRGGMENECAGVCGV